MRTNFFKVLHRERTSRKMTIEEFCNLIEVRPATYSSWSRSGQPTLGKAFRIMEILHIPIYHLELVDRTPHGNRKQKAVAMSTPKPTPKQVDNSLPFGTGGLT